MKTVYIKRLDLFKDLDMVLCNNISQADPAFMEDNMHIYYGECESCEGEDCEGCEDCGEDGRYEMEPYQMFLIDGSEYNLERLKDFGITIGYSELLGVHVLPIYDYGTGWSHFSYRKEVEDGYELCRNETFESQTVY